MAKEQNAQCFVLASQPCMRHVSLNTMISKNARDRKCCWGCAYILCFVSIETEAQGDATPGHEESKHVETCDLLSNKHQGSEPETGTVAVARAGVRG